MNHDAEGQRESRRDIRLQDLMHRVASLTPDVAAREALEIMLEHRVSAVPVVDQDGRLEGVVTDAVLLDSAVPRYLKYLENFSFVTEEADKWVSYIAECAQKPVREIMSREVSKMELGHSEVEAVHKMVHDGVPSVVIVDDGKPVGVVTRLDLYAAIADIS